REVLRPLLHGAGTGARAAAASTRATAACGSVRSAGDVVLHADDARTQEGVDGSGVTVGILSDTYDLAADDDTDAAADVASGDLPGAGNPCGRTTPVAVLDDGALDADPDTVPTDEGRAMAQLVHDLAPGAQLSFATAFTGQQGFADNIRRLRAAGAQVLADDVGYLDEPFFQAGPIDEAITDVRRDGASYYAAAGNSNVLDASGRPIGSWETAALRPTTTGVPVAPAGTPADETLPAPGSDAVYEDFDPDPDRDDPNLGITVPQGATLLLDLQWAEPWDGVRTDLDLYLHDAAGRVLASSTDENAAPLEDGGQRPVEILSWENTGAAAVTVDAAIVRSAAGAAGTPRAKLLIATQGGGDVDAIEYPTSSGPDTVGPTVFGHSGGEDTVSVAAVDARSPLAPETYSSRGPVTHLFGPVRADGRPADALPAARTLAKPDLAATDCTRTTFFSGASHVFCGTSAAAPHAAAADALARQAAPWADDD
ncbi:S8 family serine peptidase, partial [Patulibacter sp. S7RM1-6]